MFISGTQSGQSQFNVSSPFGRAAAHFELDFFRNPNQTNPSWQGKWLQFSPEGLSCAGGAWRHMDSLGGSLKGLYLVRGTSSWSSGWVGTPLQSSRCCPSHSRWCCTRKARGKVHVATHMYSSNILFCSIYTPPALPWQVQGSLHKSRSH